MLETCPVSFEPADFLFVDGNLLANTAFGRRLDDPISVHGRRIRDYWWVVMFTRLYVQHLQAMIAAEDIFISKLKAERNNGLQFFAGRYSIEALIDQAKTRIDHYQAAVDLFGRQKHAAAQSVADKPLAVLS